MPPSHLRRVNAVLQNGRTCSSVPVLSFGSVDLAHQIEKSDVLPCVRNLLSNTLSLSACCLTQAHHLLCFYSILFTGTTLKCRTINVFHC